MGIPVDRRPAIPGASGDPIPPNVEGLTKKYLGIINQALSGEYPSPAELSQIHAPLIKASGATMTTLMTFGLDPKRPVMVIASKAKMNEIESISTTLEPHLDRTVVRLEFNKILTVPPDIITLFQEYYDYNTTVAHSPSTSCYLSKREEGFEDVLVAIRTPVGFGLLSVTMPDNWRDILVKPQMSGSQQADADILIESGMRPEVAEALVTRIPVKAAARPTSMPEKDPTQEKEQAFIKLCTEHPADAFAKVKDKINALPDYHGSAVNFHGTKQTRINEGDKAVNVQALAKDTKITITLTGLRKDTVDAWLKTSPADFSALSKGGPNDNDWLILTITLNEGLKIQAGIAPLNIISKRDPEVKIEQDSILENPLMLLRLLNALKIKQSWPYQRY